MAFHPEILRPGTIFTAFILSCVMLVAHAGAFMDNGGRISRDLAVGGYDATEENLYLSWQGTGGSAEPLTLYALCADGDCDSVPSSFASCTVQDPSSGPSADVEAETCAEPCRWKVRLPFSRGNSSFAPPVVGPDGSVYVATRNSGSGGKVFAFEKNGSCKWVYEPEGDDSKGGFYARPVVYTIDSTHWLVMAVSQQSPSHLHVIADGSGFAAGTERGQSYIGAPHKVDGEVFFEPIVDDQCHCGGGSCDNLSCAVGSAGCPRVYVGVHGGSSKRGLYAIDIQEGTASPGWVFTESATPQDDALRYRLGGVLVDLGTQRFVVGNLANTDGTVAIELPGCSSPTTSPNASYAANGSLVKQTHRSRPVLTEKCDGQGCTPVLYVGQKEAWNGGVAAVHRFEPHVPAGGGTVVFNFNAVWSWPNSSQCSAGTLPHTSWSSPVVDSAGRVYVGTNQDSGIHRLVPGSNGGCPTQTVGSPWIDYRPNKGWRTTAAFSGGGGRVHIGTTYDRVYSFDGSDDAGGCSALEWCFEMEKVEQDPEEQIPEEGGLCTPESTIPCCEDFQTAVCP